MALSSIRKNSHTGISRPPDREFLGASAGPVRARSATGRAWDDDTLRSIVDHLGPRPDRRRDVARVVLGVRAHLAQTGDAGQWVFRHLRPLHPRASRPWPSVPDLSTTPFLVQPWLDRWRWPEAPGADSSDEGELTADVLGHVASADREPVRAMLAGAGASTEACRLHLDTCDSTGRSGAAGVMVLRGVGTAAHATIVGVLLHASTHPADRTDLRGVDRA